MTFEQGSGAKLREAKKILRARILAARDAMSPQARQAAAECIFQRLWALDAYRNADSVCTYMSFGTELNTHAFFDRLLAEGKTVALPRIDKDSKSLSLHRVRGHRDLVDGVWGIREPHADTPSIPVDDIDMMLLPGVAFDLSGNRLGYGAGYYDRLLALASTLAKPVRVAAAFDRQVVDEVPAGPADVPFHILVTEMQFLSLSS